MLGEETGWIDNNVAFSGTNDEFELMHLPGTDWIQLDTGLDDHAFAVLDSHLIEITHIQRTRRQTFG